MKIIPWKASALVLSWALLAALLKIMNLTSDHLDRATFGAVLVASAGYLIATTALLKPITRNPK
jgi:hypothetical protein